MKRWMACTVVVVAACGGGGAGTEPTTQPPVQDGGGSTQPTTPPPVQDGGGGSTPQPPVVQVDSLASVRGLLCTGPDNSGWCWQAPQPGPQVLGLVQYTGGGQGWVAGEDGLILHTADDGRTWQVQSGIGIGDLVGLAADDQARGWAWDMQGRTRVNQGPGWVSGPPLPATPQRAWVLPDGGLAFSEPSSISSETLLGPTCDSPVRGWASRNDLSGWTTLALSPRLLTRPTPATATLHGATGRCGEQWGRSTDSGQTFKAQTDVDPTLRLLAMGDGGQSLWALVGRPTFDASGAWTGYRGWLYRSRDDGLHWGEAVQLPADLRHDSFVLRDGVGALAWSDTFGSTSSVSRSLDGGRSWQPLPVPAGTAEYVLHSRDWVVAAMADGTAQVSPDMGRTWVATPVFASRPLRLVEQADHSLALAFSTTDVRRSPDGGLSWATAPSGPSDMGNVAQLVMFDALNGLASRNGGQALTTADGGRHWTAAASDMPALANLHLTPDGTAWAFNDRRLMRSTDRGRQWTPIGLPPDVAGAPRSQIRGRMLDAQTGWVGTDATTCFSTGLDPKTYCELSTASLHVTTDGGQHWSARTLPAGWGHGSLAMAAGGLMLTVSDDGKVYRSTNAGRDWATVTPAGLASTPNALWVLDAQHAWMTAGNQVWRSVDGGASWAMTLLPPLADGRDALPSGGVFADASHGWMRTSGSGVVLATSDGGLTWAPQAIGSGSLVRGVFALDAQHLWLATDRGIMATATGGR